MTEIRLAGNISPLERAELELREAEALLVPSHSVKWTLSNHGHVDDHVEVGRVADMPRPQESVEVRSLVGHLLEAHLQDLRDLENEDGPRFETINDLGVMQFLARDDNGNVVRRVTATIPKNKARFTSIPIDVEVDVPVLPLLASCDTSDRVRFLADLVRRASNAVRLFGCSDRGLRSAVRLLREAMASYAEEHPADADQSGHDNASGKPSDLNHAASVPAENGGVS